MQKAKIVDQRESCISNFLRVSVHVSCFGGLETSSHSVAPSGLRHMAVLLPRPSKNWNYGFEPFVANMLAFIYSFLISLETD